MAEKIDKQQRDDFINAREFSRVTVYMPLQVRLVPHDDAKFLRSRIPGEPTNIQYPIPPEVDDRSTAEWLQMINSKLDVIISALNSQREGFSSLPFHEVNISAGGMSIVVSEAYASGDILEIKTVLYMVNPVSLLPLWRGYSVRKGTGRFSDSFEIRLA